MTLLDPTRPTTGLASTRVWPRRGAAELGLLGLLYVAYSASRLLADGSPAPAADRADVLLRIEHTLGLAWEEAGNRLFVEVDLLGLLGSYWYASAHYLVTAVVLVWLYRRHPTAYIPARRALLLATVLALLLYLLVPMAPPRLVPGYDDVLGLHASAGWWGGDASAPKGLGGLTNQLAAFPSMHAGWALWVAVVVQRVAPRWRGLGWTHALVTAVVVIGTGNHWVLDVVIGWLVVLLAVAACDRAVRTRPRVRQDTGLPKA